MWSRLPNSNASNRLTRLPAELLLRVLGQGVIGQCLRQRLTLVVITALMLNLSHSSSAQTQSSNAATTSPPIPISPAPQEIGTKILHQSLHAAVWGPPALCEVHQTVELYGHKMSGFGKYVRGGQGSGKLRMSLQLPAGDQMNSLLQVSDGELLYTLETIGSVAKRTRVDLGKVRERLVITTQSLHDPVVAMYLAIGGQAELLRKLCQQYEWIKVEAGKLDDQPVWWLTGKLAASPPTTVRALAEIDQLLFVQNQSALLPTEVILAVGRQEANLPYWLFQVEQFRPADLVTPLGYKAKLSIVTEWANPILLSPSQITPELFESKSTDDVFDEENKLYLPPETAPAIASSPAHMPANF
ncbi:MAG: hypothetical protein R3C53_02445 [Pirellulaceae bacterium]